MQLSDLDWPGHWEQKQKSIGQGYGSLVMDL